jgi:hypothetical protein
MKIIQKVTLAIGLIGLLYSCQSTHQVLSKSDKRMEIMNEIANNESMSKEMMGILMNGKNHKMMMKESHAKMMEMMKENPEMMKSMMSEMMKENPEMMKENHAKMMEMMKKNPEMRKTMMAEMMKSMKNNPEMMKTMMAEMMEASKNDDAMMSGMCKSMMENEKMMDMMEKMKNEKMDMNKMKGMDKKPEKKVDHKAHH